MSAQLAASVKKKGSLAAPAARNAVPAEVVDTLAVAKKKFRGGCYSRTEDILVSKAFISASCDPKHGTSQIGKTFQDTMHRFYYQQLLVEQEKLDSSRLGATGGRDSSRLGATGGRATEAVPVYDQRTPSAIHDRFRKFLSPRVMKFVGVTATTDKPSGHNDETYYQMCRDIFIERNASLGDSDDFRAVYMYLKDKEKWKRFSASELAIGNEKNARPVGQKKDKKERDVKEIATKVVSSLKVPESGENASISPFYDKAGKALDCFAISMQQQNQIKLLETKQQQDMQLFTMLSSPQKRQWTAAKFEVAMAKTKAKKAALDLEEHCARMEAGGALLFDVRAPTVTDLDVDSLTTSLE